MKMLIRTIFKRSLLISSCVIVAASTGLSLPVYAAPTYNIKQVLVAEDQYQGEVGVKPKPKPVYKPHEVAVIPCAASGYPATNARALPGSPCFARVLTAFSLR